MNATVLVTGPPAAGKTSLAVPLAKALDLPLFGKDTIKEALYDSLIDIPEQHTSRRLSDASYRVLVELLRDSPAAVVDANLPAAWIEEFSSVARDPLQLFCLCPLKELERRLRARVGKRHPAHDDLALVEQLRSETLNGLEPLPLDAPLLKINTTRPAQVSALAEWVHDHCGA